MSTNPTGRPADELLAQAISKPLVRHVYTADPSAHVFEGRVYVYPSHDIESGVVANDLGDQYAMQDYHVFRQESPEGEAVDCGCVLHVRDVPWADRQMWAPDAAERDGRYYLYFPAKRADGVFQIGVARADRPDGPFIAEPEPIHGSYSIDPAVFRDVDGSHLMVFGGIWGGQLQQYRDNRHSPLYAEPVGDAPALGPRIARLTVDMLQFAEAPRELQILDAESRPLRADDHARRYFEGPWMHRHDGRYYLSYSTGNTHTLCYATADSPYGPFVWQGVLMTPVLGWTTHHSIVEFKGRWWLYYHDASLSGGVDHLRCIKCTELEHLPDGRIRTVRPYGPA